MSVVEGGVGMAGMKRACALELVSNDGDSFSAMDGQGGRTMGRSTRAIQFLAGDTVGIQDHENGTYYLHRVHTNAPGFLMENAEESAMGPGCSAEAPGARG